MIRIFDKMLFIVAATVGLVTLAFIANGEYQYPHWLLLVGGAGIGHTLGTLYDYIDRSARDV